MRFYYLDREYSLEFCRERTKVKVRDEYMKNVFRLELSKYPFTEAVIREVDPKQAPKYWTIYKFAKVGCLPSDYFSLEDGRLQALKRLTIMIPREMRGPLWNAYHSRFKNNQVPLAEENRRLRKSLEEAKKALKDLQVKFDKVVNEKGED